MTQRIYYSPQTVVHTPNIYGDGADGNGHFTSDQQLDRDYNYENLTIDAGVIVDTFNYRLFVRNVLINNGTIRFNGNDASGTTHGSGRIAKTLLNGADGADGATAVQAGNDATARGNIIGVGGLDTATGGSGGAAGADAGGVDLGHSGDLYDAQQFHNVVNALLMEGTKGGTIGQPMGGGGGGGGGNASGGGTNSGAGGGGGCNVLIAARVIDNTNGTIEALGGIGSDASGAGNAGGGGGGGGGNVILLSSYLAQGTISVAGGAGGAGVGTGAAGAAGGDGNIILVSGVNG